MNIKYRKKINQFRKSLSKKWYKLMKPLADYLYKRDNEKYRKTKDNLTEDQAVKLMARDLSKYIAKRTSPIELIIAEYVNTEDTGGDTLSDYSFDFKKGKSRIGYYKFGHNVDFQIRLIYELRKIKGIEVRKTDWQPERWMSVRGFEGLYEIKIEE